MQQHHGAPVRLRGGDVHIGHPHLFAVIHQRQQLDGVGIGKPFEPDAVRFARRLGCLRAGEAAHDEGKADNDRTAHRKAPSCWDAAY